MTAAVPLIAGLTAEERGFVLAALGLGLGPQVADALAGPAGGRCRAVLEASRLLPAAARADLLAHVARAARETPFPVDAALAHESWWTQALADEPAELVAALVMGGPPDVRAAAAALGAGDVRVPARLPPDLLADLQKLVFADLAISAATTGGTPRATSLLGLAGEALLGELAAAGARVLGASLAGAPPAVCARAMAGVGPRFASEVQAAALAGEGGSERDVARKDVASAAGEGAGSVEERLASIGARALARELAGEPAGVRHTLARRLPVAIGRWLLTAHEERVRT